MTISFSIGIDVGKYKLDVGTKDRYLGKFDNTDAGHDKLISKLHGLGDIKNICIESTGVYSRDIVRALFDQKFSVHLVPPNRVRNFAKSIGQRAKTDKIDASIIALFAEKAELRPYTPNAKSIDVLRALVDRRDQILEDKTREKNRLEACRDTEIRSHLREHIAYIENEETLLDKRILEVINQDAQLREKSDKLLEVSGVGMVTAAVLLAYLPELGTVNRQHICALSGMAPYDNSSGEHCGKKYLTGGRQRIRRALYMSVLSATRFNKTLCQTYQHLLQRGKIKKVAQIACARKLLVHLNGLIAPLHANE